MHKEGYALIDNHLDNDADNFKVLEDMLLCK